MEITKIGVVGAGTMGHGIAQIFASAGYEVVIIDVDQSILLKSVIRIQGSLSHMAEGGHLKADKKEIFSRISTSTQLSELAQCQLVIEAAPEKFELKKQLMRDIDRTVKKALIASTTSSISITKLAASTKNPQYVIGMHFHNPPQTSTIVEIVPGAKTTRPTISQIQKLVEELGKTPVLVKDVTGFVLHRIYIPAINDAISLVQDGAASCEDIDLVMEKGANWPMGPLKLADQMGLDVVLDVIKVFAERYRGRYVVPKLLVQKVKKGELGKKSGKGFYSY